MTATITRGVYFPCAVQLPDEPRPRRRQYVVLAEGGAYSGLHTFTRPGAVGEVVLPIDWTRTGDLPSKRDARNGVYVVLADGRQAVITPGSGCSRCGTMGKWEGPAWSHSVSANAR